MFRGEQNKRKRTGTLRRSVGHRGVLLIGVLFALLGPLFLTASAQARPTPPASNAATGNIKAVGRPLSDAERFALFCVGSLSLGASVAHRLRAMRQQI
jgi:hypothetical protein